MIRAHLVDRAEELEAPRERTRRRRRGGGTRRLVARRVVVERRRGGADEAEDARPERVGVEGLAALPRALRGEVHERRVPDAPVEVRVELHLGQGSARGHERADAALEGIEARLVHRRVEDLRDVLRDVPDPLLRLPVRVHHRLRRAPGELPVPRRGGERARARVRRRGHLAVTSQRLRDARFRPEVRRPVHVPDPARGARARALDRRGARRRGRPRRRGGGRHREPNPERDRPGGSEGGAERATPTLSSGRPSTCIMFSIIWTALISRTGLQVRTPPRVRHFTSQRSRATTRRRLGTLARIVFASASRGAAFVPSPTPSRARFAHAAAPGRGPQARGLAAALGSLGREAWPRGPGRVLARRRRRRRRRPRRGRRRRRRRRRAVVAPPPFLLGPLPPRPRLGPGGGPRVRRHAHPRLRRGPRMRPRRRAPERRAPPRPSVAPVRSRESRQGVRVRARHVPAQVRGGDGAPRVRPRRRPHERRQDRRRGVRHRDGPARQAEGRVHLPAESPVQPKVPPAQGRVRGRRAHDRRQRHRPRRRVPGHDHGDPALHAVQGRRGDARGRVGDLRRGALHARPRSRRRVGRDHRHAPGRGAVRLPLRDDSKRARVRGVDREGEAPDVPHRVHGLQADAAGALPLPRGRGRGVQLPRSRGDVPAREFPQGAQRHQGRERAGRVRERPRRARARRRGRRGRGRRRPGGRRLRRPEGERAVGYFQARGHVRAEELRPGDCLCVFQIRVRGSGGSAREAARGPVGRGREAPGGRHLRRRRGRPERGR